MKIFDRLNKYQVKQLIYEIEVHMNGVHGNSIPAHLQILIGLSFIARGEYQYTLSKDLMHPSSQSSVCRIINRFLKAVITLTRKYVRFPSSKKTRKETAKRFKELTGWDGILGLMDGTVIRILRPISNEDAYYSYKACHCLNVQLV